MAEIKRVQVSDPGYDLENGVLYDLVYQGGPWDDELDDGKWVYEPILKVGDKVVLAERVPERGQKTYFWTHDLEGIGGNMNPRIKRTYGWRGTSYGVSINALGVWEAVSIRRHKSREGTFLIRFKFVSL